MQNKIRKKIKLITAGIVLIVLAVFCWFQNNYIVISDYIYSGEKVSKGLDGYTIVQISDLHNKEFGDGQQRLLEKIAECEPNMIVVTGDIADSRKTDFSPVEEFISGAVKIAPVYYATGNHEERFSASEFESLIDIIENSGAVYLSNRILEIPAEDSSLAVMLAHEPQYIDTYSQMKPDLIFSGHAHGGQFRLPLVGGLVAPGQGFFPEYTEGVHQSGESTMYISRGLGNSLFPLRLFNYPEIVCVTLKNAG